MNEFLLKRIEPFLESGDIKIGDKAGSSQFNDYIVENYQWSPFHIIWNQIADARSIDLLKSNQEAVAKFIRASRLGTYEYVGMVYSASEECLIMTLQFLVDNEEFLTSLRAPHQCYFVGVNDQYEVILEDFIEYEFSGGIRLTGKMRLDLAV